jgi:hypothetical protein
MKTSTGYKFSYQKRDEKVGAVCLRIATYGTIDDSESPFLEEEKVSLSCYGQWILSFAAGLASLC